jgi:hypothetical protein
MTLSLLYAMTEAIFPNAGRKKQKTSRIVPFGNSCSERHLLRIKGNHPRGKSHTHIWNRALYTQRNMDKGVVEYHTVSDIRSQGSGFFSLTGDSVMTVSVLIGDLASSIMVVDGFSEADDFAAAALFFLLLV